MRCRNSYKKTACTFPYARTYKKESVFRLIRGKYRTTKIFNEKKELVTTNSRIDYRELKQSKGLWRPSNGIEREMPVLRGYELLAVDSSVLGSDTRQPRFVSHPRTERIVPRPPLFLHRISCNTELLSPETAALSRTRGEDIRARAPPSATSLPCSFSCSLSDSTSGPMFSAWYIAGREPEELSTHTLGSACRCYTSAGLCGQKRWPFALGVASCEPSIDDEARGG